MSLRDLTLCPGVGSTPSSRRSDLARAEAGLGIKPTATAVVLMALLAALAPLPACALVEPEPQPLDAAVRPAQWILEEAEEVSPEDASEAGRAVAEFRRRAGGSWHAPVDRRTGKALLIQGTGIPMAPGAGNRLRAQDMPPGLLNAEGRPTLTGLDRAVRAFLQEHRTLFLPTRGELVLNENRSAVLEDGKVAFVDYDWTVDGVPVEGARVFTRLNNGNLIQAGTRLIGRVDVSAVPRLAGAEALGRARDHAGLAPGDVDEVGERRLILLPMSSEPLRYRGPMGGGVSYRLAWEIVMREHGRSPTWTARVDAHSGEILEFFDANQYAGQIVGGVYPRTVSDQEVVWPFANTAVSSNGNTQISTLNGAFALPPGGIVAASLDGKYFDTNCQSCASPAQPLAARTFGAGIVDFGTGGLDQTGNGLATRADRNTFYHLNYVRLVAKKWLNTAWLDTNAFRVNVNINNSCNAYYDGYSVNFYRSSSTCNNTGEIADVIDHEWGHGLDGNTAGGDGATGEATADTVAAHVTQNHLVGPFFRTSGGAVRDINWETTSKGLLTTANVASKCPSGTGPLGRQVHCEGEIYGQTTWDLAMALVAKYDWNTGWRVSERLFFTALPQSVTYLPNQGGSVYDAYMAVDDDDGNLGNGTPHATEIFNAFNRHLIAGTQRSSSAGCVRPAQPALTATPGCDSVALSWNAVPGAASYRIQKTWQPNPAPFLVVATVAAPGTSWTDTDVTPGITYRYLVQAVTSGGCESVIRDEVPASPIPRPRLDVTSLVVDDTPLGNRSGTIDPGETVDLILTLSNAGNLEASGIQTSLASTSPGITVTGPGASYPSLVPGQSAPGQTSFRISVAAGATCGGGIDLTLSAAAAGALCPADTSQIRLETGTRAPVRINHDFESSAGWALDTANTTASAGSWTRGDPFPTNYQPGDDVALTGSACWYTGSNSTGADDAGDVDAGQATLLSPVMDLTGLSTARLTYWRWFGQRDIGDDPSGDYFTVEASNNGGTSWTALETLGDGVNAASWTQKEFALESFMPVTGSMRFRVRVSDGTKPGDMGDIIEGAIDEFRVTDVVCDLTPPCFTPPLFDGLQSAAVGTGCGETELAWASASSRCQNATVTYNVYRSQSPVFAPSPANRVASGITGLTWRDTGLPAGGTFSYIVRANDSRSGEDSNGVVRGVQSLDASAPTFPGIGYSSTGYACGETVLSWAPAQDCTAPLTYRVYRSLDPLFTPSPASLVAETSATAYMDAALAPGTAFTYLVRARDSWGNEESNLVRTTIAAYGQPETCGGCAAPTPVGRIVLRKQSQDLVLDWGADPVSATRYMIYQVSGPGFGQAIRIGSTVDRVWTQQSGLRLPAPAFYFVSAINACGQESAFDTEP